MELCLHRWTAAWKAATAVSPFPLSFSCNIAAEVVWAEKAVAGRATTFARALSAARSSGRRCREEEWTRRQLSRVVSRPPSPPPPAARSAFASATSRLGA
ncbi:Os10g0147732 [Oryza sativa Japonica Group]|uniref:Os10g0147732 protein n=1 Tax=Oryza sativa subsp. japonica TaxID=39947 RepID=A0A0P0XRP3_ORYSJ|nr:Os10g0147732 [Oryza sativa Japonica Group]